jgi:hypothetical protein
MNRLGVNGTAPSIEPTQFNDADLQGYAIIPDQNVRQEIQRDQEAVPDLEEMIQQVHTSDLSWHYYRVAVCVVMSTMLRRAFGHNLLSCEDASGNQLLTIAQDMRKQMWLALGLYRLPRHKRLLESCLEEPCHQDHPTCVACTQSILRGFPNHKLIACPSCQTRLHAHCALKWFLALETNRYSSVWGQDVRCPQCQVKVTDFALTDRRGVVESISLGPGGSITANRDEKLRIRNTRKEICQRLLDANPAPAEEGSLNPSEPGHSNALAVEAGHQAPADRHQVNLQEQPFPLSEDELSESSVEYDSPIRRHIGGLLPMSEELRRLGEASPVLVNDSDTRNLQQLHQNAERALREAQRQLAHLQRRQEIIVNMAWRSTQVHKYPNPMALGYSAVDTEIYYFSFGIVKIGTVSMAGAQSLARNCFRLFNQPPSAGNLHCPAALTPSGQALPSNSSG